MKLVNMKQDRDDSAKEMAIASSGPSDQYPWGLRVTLTQDELDKLGIKTLPAVGSKLKLVAEVEVVSREESQSQSQGGDEQKRKSLGLVMCKLGIGKRTPESAEEAIEDGLEESY